MYRLPDYFPALNQYSELFNATTSDINLGVQASQAIGAQTTLAYIKTAGAGESNFGYIWGQTPSASSSGPRFYVFDDGANPTRRFIFQGHSTGTAGAPGRNTANDSATVGQWFHVGATWDGGLAATGIKIYYGKAGAPLAEETGYTSPSDGTGSASYGVGNEFHIGNRAGTDRTFNGQIGYVVRWNRVLSKQELLIAQVFGPESVPEGLILNWRAGEDNGPLGLSAVSKTAVVESAAPPFMPIYAPAVYAAVVSGGTINCGLGSATASGFTANISAGSTIACTVGSASASGFTADISVTATINCSMASASATGFAATVSSSATVDCALGSAAASGFTADIQTYAIKDDYERSSVNLSGSSVTGSGDSAVIVIKPRVQESEVKSSQTAWLEPSAKITGINGIRPTFRFSDYASTWADGKYHGVPWGTSRRPMFSYDRLTWTYFDTQSITGTYIEFRHNTAFAADTVYISRERQVSVTQVGEWIDSIASAHPTKISAPASAVAFTPTLTSWPAQSYISDEYSAQTNELGATIPATPFYAFQINDTSLMPTSGVKRVAVMTSGVHAGEDTGNWAMQRAIEYLLGSSAEAQYVRRHFRVLCYPMINAPGRYGGGWRGSFTQGTSGADDANRHFNETGSGLEIVNKPKTAMTTDRDGVVPAFVFDWHGKFESPWGFFSGSTALTSFGSLLSTNFGTTVDDMGALSSGGQTEYWRNSVGTPLAMTLEFGNNVTVSDAQYESFGVAFAETVEGYFQYIDAAVGEATASGFASTIVATTVINCSIGESTASGISASIVTNDSILCGVGEATASGYQSGVSSQITISATPGAAVAAGYTAVIESAFTLLASMGQADASGLPADITVGNVISCAVAAANAAGFNASIADGSMFSARLRFTVPEEQRMYSVAAEHRNYTIKEAA